MERRKTIKTKVTRFKVGETEQPYHDHHSGHVKTTRVTEKKYAKTFDSNRHNRHHHHHHHHGHHHHDDHGHSDQHRRSEHRAVDYQSRHHRHVNYPSSQYRLLEYRAKDHHPTHHHSDQHHSSRHHPSRSPTRHCDANLPRLLTWHPTPVGHPSHRQICWYPPNAYWSSKYAANQRHGNHVCSRDNRMLPSPQVLVGRRLPPGYL